MVIKVAERYIYLKRLVVKLIENIISEYTDISSFKTMFNHCHRKSKVFILFFKKNDKNGL